METTLVAPRQTVRRPISALQKLTIAALIGIALSLVFLQAVIIGMLIPPLAVFAALALVFAGLVAWGFRWTPLLGTLLGGALFAMDGEPIITSLSQASLSLPTFTLGVLMLPSLVFAIVGGIAATVQNYRFAPAARHAPRGLSYLLTTIGGVMLGAILVAVSLQGSSAAGIDPQALSGLPSLGASNFEFQQKEIRAKVGETVTLKLTNGDKEAHFLDIDELNVHAPMPAGNTSLAVFKPTQAGTYTFYCHPHADKASGEGMVGTLIVEP